jgi:signal transduction histidine kinase
VSAYPVQFDTTDRSKEPVRIFDPLSETVTSNAYRIDVRDSGCGIPSEHIQSIFEEYTSYAGCKDRAGGGLGLAICRMIIDAHHGLIWAESGETGTQFSVVLPYGRPVFTPTLKIASKSVKLRSKAATASARKLSA